MAPTRVILIVLTPLCVSLACKTTGDRSAIQSEKQTSGASAPPCCKESGAGTQAAEGALTAHTAGYQTATVWLEPDDRSVLQALDVELNDQQGNELTFKDLGGAPVAVSFIYTRCENRNKCPKTTRALAQLQRDVQTAGLGDEVHLALMTYDPEYDTPSVLYDYATKYGIRLDGRTLMLRPDPQRKRELFDELDVAVSFGRRDVSIHGIQLILLDKHGRYVRTYRTLIWENAKVIEDLKRLAGET
jgi:protein SCO1/2